jgi:predicted O-linked N-acetylglucosamine transferase (SPINDLY family)
VQVTWLGYLNTTGTTRIQYRLCDAYTDPPGVADRLHTETLVRLPDSQWCYRPFLSVDFSETPPFTRNGFVTFGSFNDVSKISPTVRKLWAEILAQSPLSRLVIVGASEGHARDGLIRDFSALGVDLARVEVLPRLSLDEYFGRFNAVDIALDTMPYSGGTTTCDALWMGVPVISLPGSRSASRSSASILSTAGLPEWIASSPEAYVELAVKSARDPRGLTELRRSLRNRLLQSPLMDEPRFARDLEDAYRRMWQEWCRDAGQ